MRIATIISALVAASTGFSQNGAFDPSFGPGGYTLFDPTSFFPDRSVELIVDGAGRPVAGGNNYAGNNTYCWVCRALPNGGMDNSFGGDGCVDVNLCTSNDALADMRVLSDGRIMGIGSEDFGLPFTYDQSVVFRLNVDGTLDTTWAHTGKAFHGFSGQDLGSLAMDIAADGSVLALGYLVVGAYWYERIWRFLPDGAIDTTFQNNGFLSVQLAYPEWVEYSDIMFQSTGRFLIAGRETSTYGGTFGAWNAIRRYTAEGNVDSTFAVDGLLRDTISGRAMSSPKVLLLPDDRILLYGTWTNGTDVGIGMARYLPDGDRDPSFGQNGTVLMAPFGSSSLVVGNATLLSDGRVALPVPSSTSDSTEVIAILPDGTQDLTFGFGGTAHGNYAFVGHAAAAQGDSAIVVVSASSNQSLAYLRYRVASIALGVALAGHGVPAAVKRPFQAKASKPA